VDQQKNVNKLMNEQSDAMYIKLYSSRYNRGEIHTVVDGVDVDYREYTVINGKEEWIGDTHTLENVPRGFMSVLQYSTGVRVIAKIRSDGALLIQDPVTGELTLPQTPKLILDDGTSLQIREADSSTAEELSKQLDALSEDDKKTLSQQLASPSQIVRTIEGTNQATVTANALRGAIERLTTKMVPALPDKFYSNVNPASEFPVARPSSDHLYRLPDLLDSPKWSYDPKTKQCLIWNEVEDSTGRIVRLEHRVTAEDEANAEWLVKWTLHRLKTRGVQMLLALWKMAGDRRSLTVDFNLTEAMEEIWPRGLGERESYFQTADKEESWTDIQLLDATKLLRSKRVTKQSKSGKTAKKKSSTYHVMQLARITHRDNPGERYPQKLTVELYDPQAFIEDALQYVAAPYKKDLMRLPASDLLLGVVTTARAAQVRGETHVEITRDKAVRAANLSGTNASNPRQATARLKKKYTALKKVGGILEMPSAIPSACDEKISVRVRPDPKDNPELK
jgi:hypothetical protein